MSKVTISGVLILDGNLICDEDIEVTSTGLIVPVPGELMESYNDCTEDDEE